MKMADGHFRSWHNVEDALAAMNGACDVEGSISGDEAECVTADEAEDAVAAAVAGEPLEALGADGMIGDA